jgi:hypothetical protein
MTRVTLCSNRRPASRRYQQTDCQEVIVHEDGPTAIGLIVTFEHEARGAIELQIGLATDEAITSINARSADKLMVATFRRHFKEYRS